MLLPAGLHEEGVQGHFAPQLIGVNLAPDNGMVSTCHNLHREISFPNLQGEPVWCQFSNPNIKVRFDNVGLYEQNSNKCYIMLEGLWVSSVDSHEEIHDNQALL